MIETGLFHFATSNATIAGLSAPAPAGGKAQAFYFSKLPKGAPLPAIVMHRVSSPNEIETLDQASTSLQLIRGRFQFECYAQDGPNPQNATSGYLAAAALSRALRLQIMGAINSQLPDGTLIADVRLQDEFDANFEEGGIGYVYRRMLDLSILFQEQS